MKRTVKWILVLIAMMTVLALAAGTAGAEEKRTLQLEFPVNPPRRSAASVSGPDADNPVTCVPYTFTVNNGSDTNVALYRYVVAVLDGDSNKAETLYISDRTAESAFSYTFYRSGTYVLFVDRYDSAGSKAADQLQRIFEISDDGNHADNPLYRKVSEIVSGATGSPWEKAVYLHDWLTHHAYYDYHYQYYGEDGVLLLGKGVCNSYARAYELLCREAGIPVSRVRGTGYDPYDPENPWKNHAWNAIQLYGQWYLVDVTWDDPSEEGSTVTVTGNENHDYFCLNDYLMGLEHRNDNSLFAGGQCNSLAMNYLVFMGDSYAMGDGIVMPDHSLDSYTDRITALLAQGETMFTVPCEDTFYELTDVTDTSYRYSSDIAGSFMAIRRWTLLGFWMSEYGFTLEGEEGEDPVWVQAAVNYDPEGNEFFVSTSEVPDPELTYTVLADGEALQENGTVEPGQWMTVQIGEDPVIPDLEDYEISYSLFLYSGSPEGTHQEIGHLIDNDSKVYPFPAIDTPGDYYVQIWATVLVPFGDGFERHSDIREYFEFVIGEGSGEALPDTALFFPNVAGGFIPVGQEETLRAYMIGAEHISVYTDSEDGEAIGSIGFDGFAGEGTWCANAPGTYILTLTGYTYDDEGALEEIPDLTATCTVTVGEPGWDWSYEEGEQLISVTGCGPLEVDGAAPWLGRGYDIRRIMIGEGINSIGAGVFAGLDDGVRIDFRQDVLPAFAGDAFGDTVAVCRYLSSDASWQAAPSSGNVSWVWMPTFNFRAAGTFGSLWFEKDQETPGWSVDVNADGDSVTFTDMPAATAHELVQYCFDVFLNAMPTGADLAVINHVESDYWYLYFDTDCSGSLTLDSANCSRMPDSISVFAPELDLTVTRTGGDSLQELYVTEGAVDYTGDVQKVLLKLTPSGHTGAVRIHGTIGELAYYGEGSEDPSPFRGTLTVTGGIESGLVYNGWDGTMAIHGVTDAYPLSGAPGQQFDSLTGLDNTPVILYDDTEDTSFLNPEIETEGGTVPTLDMYRLRYVLGGQGGSFLMMRPLEDAGIGSESIDVHIDDYNPDFLNDLRGNVVWGSETELYVDGIEITLPGGSDGKGLGELGAGGNSTVTVQCPVETLFFQPDPWQKNHITFYIEDSVSLAYLQPNNCTLDLTLRSGGSIGSGRWKQLLRDYRNFGPCAAGAGGTLPVVTDSALRVMSWTYAQEYASILPSDADVSDAAGTQAMADLTETDLTPEEDEALASVADGNGFFALDKSKIAWIFDVSLNAYTVDESGEAAKGEAIGDLNGNTIPIQISNPTGNPDAYVIRLHEENGVLTARKLDTSIEGDTAAFESDLFSTYLLTEPGEIIPVPEMEEPTFVTPTDLTSIGDQAFSGISARIVKITEKVESIGLQAFANSGAEQAIILNADTEISDSAFSGCENLIVFGVPGGKVESWAERNHIRFCPIPQD